MPPVQTTYPLSPPAGVPGQIADIAPRKVKSGIVEPLLGLAPGLVLFHGSFEQAVRVPVTADAATADPDAIITNGASTAGVQNFSGVGLNGAIGQATLFPPRNVILTVSNHADWNATTAVVTGVDENGDTTLEEFDIPDGGNAEIVGSVRYRKITNVMIPAQAGTGGTFTAGTGTELGSVENRVAGIGIFTPARGPGVYLYRDLMPVLRQGNVFVSSETAVECEDPVYARFVASGAQVLGAVRSTPDGDTCVLIPGMRFGRKSPAGITVIEVNLPA